MSAITETAILHLKNGVDLGNAAFTSSDGSPAVHAFLQLTDTVKSQPGFVRQYWLYQQQHGHENNVLTLVSAQLDWDSFKHSIAFITSRAHETFMVELGSIFDLEKALPLLSAAGLSYALRHDANSQIVYTRFTSDAKAAREAPVTEVAFFTVPTIAHEEAMTMLEGQTIEGHPVLTVGKAWGGAIGPVFHTKNATSAAAPGELIALHGVFGYATVDDHLKWRATPEHAKVIEEAAESPLAKLGLGNAILPGGNIFVPDSSMFHVAFISGV